MAELKFYRNEGPGEMPLLGKPATNLTLQEIVSLEMNVQRSLQNTLKKKRQTIHKREQKYFYSLVSPQNTLRRAN